MQVALIPPIPMLRQFGNGTFHLLLSHLLQDNRYFLHYKEQRDRGAYLVLDNSAHENGAGDDPELLMWNCLSLNAQEVVVPDVLDDGPATVERAVSALETWFEHPHVHQRLLAASPTFMYVPQGSHVKEWERCLHDLVQLHAYVTRKHNYRQHFVIGLSKDYEVWSGGLMYLIKTYLEPLVNKLKKNGILVQVHLLGWGRDLWALEEIGKKHPWIRSTDSAKPFVYALKEIDLLEHMDSEPPKYPTRPKNYFSRTLTEEQTLIAKKNCGVFKALASGSRDNTVIF